MSYNPYPTMRHYKKVSSMNMFSFANPAQYYEFRDDWRKNYAELSAEIRRTKLIIKKGPTPTDRSAAQSYRTILRLYASNQMELIMEAKEHGKTNREIAMREREEEIA